MFTLQEIQEKLGLKQDDAEMIFKAQSILDPLGMILDPTWDDEPYFYFPGASSLGKVTFTDLQGIDFLHGEDLARRVLERIADSAWTAGYNKAKAEVRRALQNAPE